MTLTPQVVRRVLALLVVVATANVAVFVVEALVYTPLRVPSNSMWPSLQKHDRIAVNHTVGFRDLERGDLVVFAVNESSTRPARPGRGSDQHLLVKRVIGLPGETIEARQGIVAVNQTERVPEPYLLGRRGNTAFESARLGNREIWVLGDNRDHSVDSRAFGPVPASSVVGRVSFRYWPLNRWHGY